MTTKEYKYWLLHNGADKLARVGGEGNVRASTFWPHDGQWHETNHVAGYVTGYGGDSDFDEITEAEARKKFPEAFKVVQIKSPSNEFTPGS